jgi:predicted small secreted protein
MRILLLLSLLVAALALAGCGSTSGPGEGGGSAETEAELGEQQAGEDAQAPGVENDPIYHEAGNICVNLPIDQLAIQYGVEADPDAIAEAVAADYPADQREAAKAGCLAVLEEGGQVGTG